jgi:hypothetical protein
VLLAVPALWGCAAGPLVAIDGGFRNAAHGYRLGVPPPAEPPWQPVSVEGSLLAYWRPGPIRMTFSSRCGVPLSRPEILARHLRIGVPAHVVREAGPVTLDALAGWQQVFDTDGERGVVRIETVTFVANDCALDWALSAREGRGFEQAERDFEAWWQTLHIEPAPGAPPTPAAEAEPAPPGGAP